MPLRYPIAALCLILAAAVFPAKAQMPDPGASRMIDLSHPYNEETVYWPTAPSGFEKTTLSEGMSEVGWYYSAYHIATPEHGGTHMDAPVHFGEGKDSIDDIGPASLIGEAAVIDVSQKAAANADYLLSPEDVHAFEAEHGLITPGTIVLLRTGWSRHWPDAKAYLGDDRPGRTDDLHFPSFGGEAGRLLIHERKAAMIGVDTASIDGGQSREFRVHRIAANHNVPGLENLTGLEALPPRGAMIIALPMKIEGGSGAPVRVVAVIPQENGNNSKPGQADDLD